MGWVKNKMMEMEENGDWPSSGLSGKYICTHHFKDKYLNRIIENYGEKGTCSYCGRKWTVCDMFKFGEQVAWRIGLYFSSIDNADFPLADGFYDDEEEVIDGYKRIGPYIVPEENTYYESKDEMLSELGLYTEDEEINNDIESVFSTEEWIAKDVYEENKNVRFTNQWDQFVYSIINKRRFTFLASPEFVPIIKGDNKEEKDILSVLSSLIIEENLCSILPKDTKLYRARKVQDINKKYGFNDITSAPDNKAFPNRMSPAGISMFYASFEKDTAMNECVGDETKTIIVGTFETKRNLNVIDLTKIPDNSFWMDDWQGNQFLHHFNENITLKLNPEDTNHLQYVPTQVFTEYLRYMFKDQNKERVDGLIYGSSKTLQKNIVLFCNQKDSINYVDENVKIEIYKRKLCWELLNKKVH